MGVGNSNVEDEIALVCVEEKPMGSREELEKLTDILGTFTTDFGTSASGRTVNVTNACSKIDGTILYPGEEFSVYACISPFTFQNGYETASAYSNGMVIDSVGGGVCQVATTLYNAVIRAELDVSMRCNHSMTVSYVSPSEDAAIAGTYKDLRFRNNYDTPVYIEGVCSASKLTFTVYGQEFREKNRELSFISEVLTTTDPGVSITLSRDQKLGYFHIDQAAHQGITARLWKVIMVNGTEQSREIFNTSKYTSSPEYITVGIKDATEEQECQIKEAAENGDLAAVKSLVENARIIDNQKEDGENEARDEETHDDDEVIDEE